MKYNHKEIEPKWRKNWDESEIYRTGEGKDKPKYYILDMFPYPSGAGLHVGHPKGYIATDVYGRMRMMQGYNVLHPMGWDAFGLPAENFALANKVHPRIATEKNIATFKKQLAQLGFTYDWEREINTTDPEFYKWTQWIFLEMFKRGLAYESREPINWCPSCKTGLANEDLENGRCERCGSLVEKKPMRQWVLKITAYADRMLNDLDKLPDWEESIKVMQKNWIGKSEGANVKFEVRSEKLSARGGSASGGEVKSAIEVFTTRPDTLFGATYMVIAPEHELVEQLKDKITNYKEVKEYAEAAKNKSEVERAELNKEKTGVELKGVKAINPVNNEEIPVFVADYVLIAYGTGAIMAVPGHDERDFEFAKKYNLPVREVVKAEKKIDAECFSGDGVSVNSDFLDGLETAEAKKKMILWLEEKGIGKKSVSYKIKDWVFSRQRYWGEPFPLAYCENCKKLAEEHIAASEIDLKKVRSFADAQDDKEMGGFTLGELLNPGWIGNEELPVTLPEVEHYEPTGTGESPLANINEWVNTICPKCGGAAKRETNTMPQWAGSSWYYLRFEDPKNDLALVDKEKEKYWSPVDFYVGGAEHATRHLIYARFWHKFLFDIGAVSYDEPFTRLQHVGLILAEDGRKMSKRWNNVINPDEIVEKYGADAMRVYEMFMGPFSQAVAWNTNGLIGARKFLERVYKLKSQIPNPKSQTNSKIQNPNFKIDNLLHKTIKKVGEDIESFKFNTAISQMMILVNEMTAASGLSKEQYEALLKILAPFAPHLCEELWEEVRSEKLEVRSDKYKNLSIFKEEWPAYDPELIKDEMIDLVIQVNGKVRDTISVDAGISEEEAKKIALESENVKKWTQNKEVKKIVYVKGKLVSIVV
ncbi:MAG: leucine--tRNA ligase [Patescibacteria group bacterium]|jgi:leucyl-tRNA synthetase